jgi:peptidoglycan/LPS O-acetylase OafA/YrhL
LPHVFEQQPYLAAVNGALWTIKVELSFYLMVPALVYLLERTRWPQYTLMGLVILSMIFRYIAIEHGARWGWPPELAHQLPAMLAFFLMGTWFNYAPIQRVSPTIWMALLIISSAYLWMCHSPWVKLVLDPLCVAFWVMALAWQTHLPLPRIPVAMGDWSYSIYLFHFPLIQLFIYLGWFQSLSVGLCLLSLSLAILAYFSWHWIEAPLIRLGQKAAHSST